MVMGRHWVIITNFTVSENLAILGYGPITGRCRIFRAGWTNGSRWRADSLPKLFASWDIRHVSREYYIVSYPWFTIGPFIYSLQRVIKYVTELVNFLGDVKRQPLCLFLIISIPMRAWISIAVYLIELGMRIRYLVKNCFNNFSLTWAYTPSNSIKHSARRSGKSLTIRQGFRRNGLPRVLSWTR